ncbi:MAG: ABC transporter ATP-binding protein [Erysipelothrix sp.]|nr:ABC transporter ATP-binding protein [Erysipelothrix sp.]
MSRRKIPNQKPTKFKETWVQLIKYIHKYIPVIILTLIASMIGTTLQVIGPDKLKDMTNEIAKGLPALVEGVPVLGVIDKEAVTRIAFVLIAFYGLSFIINFVQSFVMSGITQKISKKMRTDINDKINRLPIKYFDSVSYGDVLSRITNDVDTIGQTMNQSITSLVTATTMFLGTLAMMIYNSWILALVAVLSTLIGFALMFFIISKSQKYFVLQQESLGELNGHIEELYSGHNVIKAYNAGKETKEVFSRINGELRNNAWKSQFLSGLMMPLMQFIGNFGYVTVSITGAALAMRGDISFGVIVAFMTYIRLFTQPLSQIAQAANGLQSAAAAGERVFEFLGEKEEPSQDHLKERLNNVQGNVEFKNVTFGYNPEKPVITDFSDTVQKGEKVAIVGPTGAGKTTLVNLLMRFYDVDQGDILIDGVSTHDVPRNDVRKQFSMVLQDTWIFEGSIKENIIYNQKGITDEEIIEACKMANLDHFINTLPDGYDTILDDKEGLSEGQKQLITIARAIIQNAPILILDEATSSVDTRTERLIQDAMDKLSSGRTSFVIAHRLSTIKNADKILVMNHGEIVEKGTHDQLLALGGFYSELYNAQFEQA